MDVVQFALRPRPDARPLDEPTAARIARVAHAETVELDGGGARFGFPASQLDPTAIRGNLEMAARFELGAHWHTRYDLVDG